MIDLGAISNNVYDLIASGINGIETTVTYSTSGEVFDITTGGYSDAGTVTTFKALVYEEVDKQGILSTNVVVKDGVHTKLKVGQDIRAKNITYTISQASTLIDNGVLLYKVMAK